MKIGTKGTYAFMGMLGLVLSAGTAQADVEANGAGSSAGSRFAADSPSYLCATTPKPKLFISQDNPPKYSEWQCTIGGKASIIRYAGSNSNNGYALQPNGSTSSTNYLKTTDPTCAAASDFTMPNGLVVSRSICNTDATLGTVNPLESHFVNWGGADVKASSLTQTSFGVGTTPPADAHLTTLPTVIVPWAIVVGQNVRAINPGTGLATDQLKSLTQEEISAIFTGNAVPLTKPAADKWADLGYGVSAGSGDIVTCIRTQGSGSLAALDQTILRHPFNALTLNQTASAHNVAAPGSSDMAKCLQNNPNSIGFIDSDSLPSLTGGGVFGVGAYQVAIDGHSVNTGVPSGVTGLKNLRCGRYPYWADWNFTYRTASLEASPYNQVAGTNVLIKGDTANGDAFDGLATKMAHNNPLPDYWLSEDDTLVYKTLDKGPINHFSPSNNGATQAATCRGGASDN